MKVSMISFTPLTARPSQQLHVHHMKPGLYKEPTQGNFSSQATLTTLIEEHDIGHGNSTHPADLLHLHPHSAMDSTNIHCTSCKKLKGKETAALQSPNTL